MLTAVEPDDPSSEYASPGVYWPATNSFVTGVCLWCSRVRYGDTGDGRGIVRQGSGLAVTGLLPNDDPYGHICRRVFVVAWGLYHSNVMGAFSSP